MWSSFTELRAHSGFTEDDEARVRALGPRLEHVANTMPTAFIERASKIPALKKVLEDTDSDPETLSQNLSRWLSQFLSAPRDRAYLETRSAVGHTHARIGLPQQFMVSALTEMREALIDALEELSDLSPSERRAARNAIMRGIDVDLALILDSFRKDLLSQVARHERLATYGHLVGSIAHELRNPLAVMETSLFLMRQAAGAAPKSLDKYLDRIERQVRVSSDIIKRMLELVNGRAPERRSVDFNELVREVVSDLPPPMDEALEVRTADNPSVVQADPVQLREVVVNLLTNAYEAAGKGGMVRLSVVVDDRGSALVIEDSGPGIAREVQPRLFEPLVTTKTGGTGLGLALVKRVVEMHGGAIAVDKGELGGARFTVLFGARV